MLSFSETSFLNWNTHITLRGITVTFIHRWWYSQAMQNRNYMYANDIYLRLAIGNAPWPIGVTSVGIHERSAREKISHVMNQHGQAHIMNDEATRKFLQVSMHVN